MTTITSEQATEVETHQFVAEASDLGLPPGEFPRRIDTNMGNGQPFVFQAFRAEVAVYRQAFGCIVLRLLND